MDVKLNRIAHNDKQTIGTLRTSDFSCRTIELPPLENKRRVSRIPAGKYSLQKLTGDQLQWSRFDYPHFWVKDVPNRSGIKIHIANYFFQLAGCIAVGGAFSHINDDGYLDVTDSKKTLDRLLDTLPNISNLTIVNEKKPTKVQIAGLINEVDNKVNLKEINLV